MSLVRKRQRAVGLLVMVSLLLFASACRGGDDARFAFSSVAVEEFQARMSLRLDGSADVEETWIVSATEGGALRRVVSASRRDALSGLTATLDDQPVMVTGESEVVWSLSPGAGRRTARVRYHAAGVIEVSGLHGTVGWQVLEARRHPPVARAQLSLVVPGGIALASDPRMAESGWRVSVDGANVAAQRSPVGRDDSATLVANLIVEPGTLPRPIWQEDAERATLLIPAFLSGGIFILVVGLGVIVMVAVQGKGWTLAERAAATRGFFVSSFVAFAFGALAWIVTPAWLGRYGRWPIAIAASILLVGLLFLMTALVRLWRTAGTR
jgi:hypothetical protein